MLSLINQAKSAGITLNVVNQQLKFSAPKGAMTEDLKANLSHNKADLIVWLENKQALEQMAVAPSNAAHQRQLAFSQKSLWLFDRIHGQSAQYNMPGNFAIHGKVNSAHLQQAFMQIIERHQVFNGQFKEQQGRPYLLKVEPKFTLQQRDLSSLPVAKQTQKVEALIHHEQQTAFDLANDLLLRVTLVKHSDERYTLLFNMHHIISDGWSMAIMTKELCEFYNALSQNRLPQLPPLTHQYGDFAHWQQQRVSGEYQQHLSDYWLTQLAGAPLLHGIAVDSPRSKVKSDLGEIYRLPLSEGQARRIGALAKQYRCSEFLVWYAAFNMLISLFSREQDIVIGTPIANREQPEFSNLVGLFVNVLVLRLNVTADDEFTTVLENAKKVVFAAFEHQDMPFELLIEQLKLTPNSSYTPLVQVMFAYQNIDIPPLSLNGAVIEPITSDQCQAKFDLQLEVEASQAQTQIKWEYDSTLFNRETIRSMSNSLLALLDKVTADPSLSLSAITLCDQQVPTPPFACKPESINARFARIKDQFSDKVVLQHGAEQLSYGQLDERSNALANALLLAGLKRTQAVALMMPRSIETVIAVLAVIKAGGCYVPIDPDYPAARQQQMLQLSNAAMVLGYEQRSDKHIDLTHFDWSKNTGAMNEPSDIAPDDLAYIMFTSGSTGTPKGVQITHDNIVSLVTAQQYVEFDQHRVIGHISNISFDAATFEIFGALLNGGRLEIVHRDTLIDPVSFGQAIKTQEIDTLFVTSALFNQLADSAPHIFATMNYLAVGGDVVNPVSVSKVFAAGKPRYLSNQYGPTEATTFSTWQRIDPAMTRSHKALPIGKPLNGRTAVIVDAQNKLLPQGAIGELALGGRGIAKGYLAQDNNHKFVEINGCGRCYLSGDLARINPDGAVEYLGRNDNQVKVRGYRIELSEIEQAVLTLDWIDDCCMTLLTQDDGEKSLVCYAAVKPQWLTNGRAQAAQQLNSELSEKLPDHLLPHFVEFVDVLPLNANGKVNRALLPQPSRANQVIKGEPPQTATEQQLAKIWQTLLGDCDISRQTNFFEVGGHSLLASQMMAHIRDTFAVQLPLSVIFASANLSSLGAQIDSSNSSQQNQQLAISPRPPGVAPVLSFAQQRFWFIEQFEQGSAAYNIPAVFHFQGQLNVAALTEAFKQLVRRHEVLRTVLCEQENQQEQQVSLKLLDADDFELQIIDSQKWSDQTFERYCLRQASQPFDLSREVMRVSISKRRECHHVLALNIHHIAADGISINLLLQELISLYSGEALPPLTIQYSDYAWWQRQQQTSPKFQAELDQLSSQLSGLPPLHSLPLDYTRPSKQSQQGETIAMVLPPAITENLSELAKSQAVSLFVLLQSAFATLLCRFSHDNDVVMGIPAANRDLPQLQSQLGCFTNTLVMHHEITPEQKFSQLLQQSKQQFAQALSLQHIPFELVVEKVVQQRSLSYNPLFQIMFVFQSQGLTQLTLPGTEVELSIPDTGISKFDLTLTLNQTDQGIETSWQYASDIFAAQTIEAMANSFRHLLTGLADSVNTPIGELELVDQAAIFALTNSSQPLPPEQLTIHQAVELQAAKSADKVAVFCDGQSLTYQQLDERANQWAHHLLTLDLEIEDLVGISMERSLDMIVAILAVLKAGCAYVPIDPKVPQQRRDFIVSDSGVKTLITAPPALEQYPKTKPNLAVSPHALAYIIYTSGSTGKPKGVQIEHNNVLRLFTASTQPGYFKFDHNDVWSLFHSYAFDFSVWEIWGALLYGAKLVIVPFDTSRSPQLFLELLQQQKVTVLNQTPSAFNLLQELAIEQNAKLDLRYVIFGGEALDPTRLRPWFNQYGEQQPKLINMYGITETTVHVTYRQIKLQDCIIARSVIGKPLVDLSYYVCSESMALQPLTAPGELYIGGAGLARGYLNRPQLTAERFMANPFTDSSNTTPVYRTGDLVRLCTNGELEYLGRTDDQVKIRGFRIELGEIEAKIKQLSEVKDAVVMVREDSPGNKKIVAYINCFDSGFEQQIKARLDGFLPEYMMPSAFIALAQFPLTSNGKIDKRALPAATYDDLASAYVAPQTQAQATLCDIIAQVLNHQRVGINDNFFALGGDSILSIKVVAQAKKAGLHFAIKDLFEQPTVGALATICRDQSSQMPTKTLSKNHFALASMQSGMLYHSMLAQGNAVYHDIVSYRLRFDFDQDRFSQALHQLTQLHGILRTTFSTDGAQWHQRVQPVVELPLTVIDLTHLSVNDSEQRIAQWIAQEKHADFKLNQQLLYRLFIHVCDDNQIQLSLSFHHAVLDGWSVASLFTQLMGLYLSVATLPAQLPQYHQFVELEQQAVACPHHRQFWQQQLAGYQVQSQFNQSAQPERFKLTFDGLNGPIQQAVKQTAKQWNMPIQHLLMTAYLRALAFCSGHNDALACMVVNGRPEIENAQHSLGLFLNVLPIRHQFDTPGQQHLNWQALTQQISDNLKQAFAFRRMPFTEIGQLSPVELPKVLFNFNNFHVFDDISAHQNIEILSHHFHEQTDFNLELQVAQHPVTGELELTIDADKQYYDRPLCQRLADTFIAALTAICQTPDQKWATSDLLDAEQKRTLAGFEQGPEVECHYANPVALFKATKATFADCQAVRCQNQTLTYQELDQLSDAWAAQLIEAGLQPGETVAMVLPRSVMLNVGFLAILKAGGVMLPLEPGLAAQRMAFIIEDAQARFILTHSSVNTTFAKHCAVILADKLNTTATLASYPPAKRGYIIYTSGSTGRPKGVAVSNAAAVAQACAMQQVYQLTAQDRSLMFASFSFDAALEQVLVAWACGARVDITPQTLFSASQFAEYCHAQQITLADLPPSYCQAMLNDSALAPFWATTSIKTLILGGESFPAGVVERWRQLGLAGKCRLINAYGPTEGVITASCHRVAVNDDDPVPIGTAVPGKSLYVLDNNEQRLPLGAIGQLYIGGNLLAEGYVGRPDLTAAVFKPLRLDGQVVNCYATGDLVRRNARGELEFIGRQDGQVQIRGYRIELGEIEQVLLQLPSIHGATVCLRDGELIAYVVTEDTQIELAKSYLSQQLPAYMQPSHFVKLDALPLTTSGKVDKTALPKVDISQLEQPIIPPSNPLESALVAIFSEVTGKIIGIDHSFFANGGTSIKALQVIAKAEAAKLGLSLAVLFNQQTPRKIAQILDSESADNIVFPLSANGEHELIAIHPYSGNALCYQALGQSMQNHRMLGVNGVGVLDKGQQFDTISALANHYIEQCQAQVGNNCWRLVGYSQGGVIAQQMAVELQNRGVSDVQLILIDALPQKDVIATDLNHSYLDLLFNLNISPIPEPQTTEGWTWPMRLDFCRQKLLAIEPMWQDITTAQFECFIRYQMTMNKALANHQYQPFSGRSLQLNTADNKRPKHNWQQLLVNNTEQTIAGDHLGCIQQPHAQTVAQIIESWLQK